MKNGEAKVSKRGPESMNTQNATPAASPDDQRIEAVMRLADEYAGRASASTDCHHRNRIEWIEHAKKRDTARNALRAALASPPVAAQVASPDLSTQQIAYALAQLPTPPKHGGELHDWAELLARELWRHYGPTSQQPTQEGA